MTGFHEDQTYPKNAVKRLALTGGIVKIRSMDQNPYVVSLRVHEPEALAEAIHHATFLPCQLSDSPSPSNLVRVICPKLCLDLVSLGASFLFTGTMAADCYTLIFILECEQRKSRAFNFSIEHNGGYMGFFPPGAILDAYTPQGYANASLSVPIPVFAASVQRMFPDIPQKVLQQGAGMRVGATEQAYLRGLLKAVMDGVENPTAPLAEESGRRQLEADLLDAFMVALRGGCESIVPAPGLRVAKRLKRLRQARDYMADHFREPVSLTELCDEMGMSRRGIEMLFRDTLGIGPNTFLRHQRLHAVRRALQSAPRESGAVKQIALTHGFWHMGHFAQEYRSLFGETPSGTMLRRAAP